MGEVRQVQFGKRTTQAPASDSSVRSESEGNVACLAAFRTRKSLTADRKVGIGDAFSGLSPLATEPRADGELSDRIERIKSSISRINQLMAELRGAPGEEGTK